MNTDYSQVIQDSICAAGEKKIPLYIMGGNTKAFYGRQLNATPLDISKHQGIVDYEPAELVLTVRAGTSLAVIESLLADQGQMLAFEPPYFGANTTLGGAVASGISGPRRPYAGAIRDMMLGVQMINGKGQKLHFGGQVMKNVAGYDISRLMAGSLGTLGVLLEISLKILPRPTGEITLSQEQNTENAIQLFNTWATQSLPLSACAFDGKRLYVRLSGSEEAVQSAHRKIGGDEFKDGSNFWEQIRDLTHKFFQQNTKSLWRWSVPAATPPIDLPGEWMIDWGGAQRWFYPDELTAESIYMTAEKLNGHATLFRGGDRTGEVFHPLSNNHLMTLHQRLKQAFDPHSILNPGRMYRGL